MKKFLLYYILFGETFTGQWLICDKRENKKVGYR